MKRKKMNLLVIAHPDDETIFFSGALLRGLGRVDWEIICVTDGNADGQGAHRYRQFIKACHLLGIKKIQYWGYPDIYEKRLPVEELSLRLKKMPLPQKVFTHNILGEYGHPHHQDTSLAVHRAFSLQTKVFSTAHNAFPLIRIHLSKKEYLLKTKILTTLYLSETQRFAHLLPATSSEGYVIVSLKEVETLYHYFVHDQRPKRSELEVFKWLWPYLKNHQSKNIPRPF